MKGKGLYGQKGVQLRIKKNAVKYFLEDVARCVGLAREFLDADSSLPSGIHEALFGVVPAMSDERLSVQE